MCWCPDVSRFAIYSAFNIQDFDLVSILLEHKPGHRCEILVRVEIIFFRKFKCSKNNIMNNYIINLFYFQLNSHFLKDLLIFKHRFIEIP